MGTCCGTNMIITVDTETLLTLSRNNPDFILPETERDMIIQVEDGVPFRRISYDYFLLALKRYGFARKIDQRVMPYITNELQMNFPYD